MFAIAVPHGWVITVHVARDTSSNFVVSLRMKWKYILSKPGDRMNLPKLDFLSVDKDTECDTYNSIQFIHSHSLQANATDAEIRAEFESRMQEVCSDMASWNFEMKNNHSHIKTH